MVNAKKILSADLDGTLMFRKEGKPYFKQSDIEALQAFREDGNLVVINSGRALAWLIPPLEGHMEWDYLIAASGACIMDRNRKILYGQTLSLTLMQELLRDYPTDVEITFITADQIYALRQKKPHSLPVQQINSVGELEGRTLYGMSVHFTTQKEAEAFRDWLLQSGHEEMEVFVNTKDVDLVRKGCSKGVALKWLQNYLALDADHIYAIGDAANDIDMLKAAAHSFTFHQSEDRVKMYCEQYVSSVEEMIQLIAK